MDQALIRDRGVGKGYNFELVPALELSQSLIADVRVIQTKFLEFRPKLGHIRQTRMGDFGFARFELLQPGQALEVEQTRVAHFGFAQIQLLQPAQAAEMSKACITDGGSVETDDAQV